MATGSRAQSQNKTYSSGSSHTCNGLDYLWRPQRWLCSLQPGSHREEARGSRRYCCAWCPQCCSRGHYQSSAPADSRGRREWCTPGKNKIKTPSKVWRKICPRLTSSLGDLRSSSPLSQLMPELKSSCGTRGRRADFLWGGRPGITGPLRHRFIRFVMGGCETLTRWWTVSLDEPSTEKLSCFSYKFSWSLKDIGACEWCWKMHEKVILTRNLSTSPFFWFR